MPELVAGLLGFAFLLLIIFVGIGPEVDAARLQPERVYQAAWCAARGGVQEVVLEDRTRCDCLTETHAVEFDFADKWAEAIGQALHYAAMTGKSAGIVLILEDPDRDRRYLEILRETVEAFGLPIDVWVVGE